MAKRGEQRPWRLSFTWDSDIRGTTTHRSQGDALDQVQTLQRNSHMRGIGITISLTDTATGKTWTGTHPDTCELEHTNA